MANVNARYAQLLREATKHDASTTTVAAKKDSRVAKEKARLLEKFVVRARQDSRTLAPARSTKRA